MTQVLAEMEVEIALIVLAFENILEDLEVKLRPS